MELKRHQTYQNQIALLKDRGLGYESHDTILNVLKHIGYYRFSGYTYPLRKPILDDQGRVKSRLDEFEAEATFEHAVELYEFDQRLRLLLQDALEVIEVAFCAQARNEDYVKHHLGNYGANLPIWAATEFMDFGSAVSLFEMMKKADQIEIAQVFGLKNDQAGILHSWMLSLNDLRNRCAHNNRVWNRVSRLPRKPNSRMTGEDFHHFNNLSESQHSNLYGVVAVVAYLIRNIYPASSWPNMARLEFAAFGEVFGMTLENTMGFPAGWQNEALGS